jgi:hypothetical protein
LAAALQETTMNEEEQLEMQGQIDGLKIIVSSLLHALPDQRLFALRFKELEVLARKQNALPSTLETLRWFRTQMESSILSASMSA